MFVFHMLSEGDPCGYVFLFRHIFWILFFVNVPAMEFCFVPNNHVACGLMKKYLPTSISGSGAWLHCN